MIKNNRPWFLGRPQGYVLAVGDMYYMCEIFIEKLQSLGNFWATKHTFPLAQENETL